MNFFRRLQAPPNPLHEAYTAATGRAVQDAVGDSPAGPGWIPVDTGHWQPIFTTLAFLDDNPGVIDHNAPGLPMPATTEGDPVSKYRDSLAPEQRADLDRLTALRESGYTGPVNQDGLPAIEENTDRRLWNMIQPNGRQNRDQS